MKRFYCTICKKYKRVRQLPKNVINVNSNVVGARQGQCKWHANEGHVMTRNTLDRKVSA